MKFRNYLDTIADIGIYPLVSLLIFFVFFIALIAYVWKMDKKTLKSISDLPLDDGTTRRGILSLFLGLAVFSSNAQDVAGEPAVRGNQELITYLLITVIIAILALVVVILFQVIRLVRKVGQTQSPEAAKNTLFSDGWWKRIGGFGTDVKDENEILIKEHEYDGIQELDNRMPPWLAFIFQATIVFAVVYMIIYQFTNIGDLPQAELAKSLKEAEIQKAKYLEKAGSKIDENSVVALKDAEGISKGKSIFEANCAACHGQNGGGTVGPNLTDDNWLHGGGVRNIFKTIKYGIPEKGMIAWEKQLKPQEIQQVASYIISIHGSKPDNPKAPEGELWKEAGAAADSTVAAN